MGKIILKSIEKASLYFVITDITSIAEAFSERNFIQLVLLNYFGKMNNDPLTVRICRLKEIPIHYLTGYNSSLKAIPSRFD